MSNFSLFYLSSREDEKLRLKSFAARTKGAVATITITLETDDMYALGHALRELGQVQKSQAAAAKPKAPQKRLALPAPESRQ